MTGFWVGLVLDWRVPGEKRVRHASTGDIYILNTNRMFEITEDYRGYPTMFFFDNGLDSKDSGNRLVMNSSIAAITTAADTVPGSTEVTLNYYPDFDQSATVKSKTIQTEDIAYFYPFNHDALSDYTWLIHRKSAWETERLLVQGSWILTWVNVMA